MELAESFSRASQTEGEGKTEMIIILMIDFRGHIPTNPVIHIGLIVELDLCPDQCYLGTRRGQSESLCQCYNTECSLQRDTVSILHSQHLCYLSLIGFHIINSVISFKLIDSPNTIF